MPKKGTKKDKKLKKPRFGNGNGEASAIKWRRFLKPKARPKAKSTKVGRYLQTKGVILDDGSVEYEPEDYTKSTWQYNDDNRGNQRRYLNKCRFCEMENPDHVGHLCPALSQKTQTCWFCGMKKPDHLGRYCPMNPKKTSLSGPRDKTPEEFAKVTTSIATGGQCVSHTWTNLEPQVFVTIVRFLGEPHQDLPESTNRHVFSQLFSISWCSRLLADFYQYWYNWESDMAFHH